MRILSSLWFLLDIARGIADKIRAPDKWKEELKRDAEETRTIKDLSDAEWRKLYERYSKRS
jgi:hypothetical protein